MKKKKYGFGGKFKATSGTSGSGGPGPSYRVHDVLRGLRVHLKGLGFGAKTRPSYVFMYGSHNDEWLFGVQVAFGVREVSPW